MRIGIIDSGKGGLAVAKELSNPEDQLILIMDKAYFPYGNKSKLFLCARSYFLMKLLISMKVDIVVIACNTLSIMALNFLKQNFSIPIFGVFEYLKPYLRPNNLFIGSKNTIDYVKEHFDVPVLDGSYWIKAIEENQKEECIQQLNQLKCNHLILGCTHFLSIPKQQFHLPVISQVDFLKEDILKYKKNLG